MSPSPDGDDLPPVPAGIQQLLRLAAIAPAFRRELLERRDDLADVAAIELTPSERAVLRAVPTAQLQSMIANLPPPPPARREFLREAASSAVLVLGGAAVVAAEACRRPERREMESEGGISPHLREKPVKRPEHRVPTKGQSSERKLPEKSREGAAERCTVIAVVETFSASASHDSYDDGHTETHAGTTLKIVEPAELRGRSLVMLHDRPPSTDSPWRARTRSVRFTIERRLLQGKAQLFSGAASNVELLPP